MKQNFCDNVSMPVNFSIHEESRDDCLVAVIGQDRRAVQRHQYAFGVECRGMACFVGYVGDRDDMHIEHRKNIKQRSAKRSAQKHKNTEHQAIVNPEQPANDQTEQATTRTK